MMISLGNTSDMSQNFLKTEKFIGIENVWLELGNTNHLNNSFDIPGTLFILNNRENNSVWETLKPEENQGFYFDTLLRFKPMPGYAGEFLIPVILKTNDPFGSSIVVDISYLHFMQKKVNYAPFARKYPNFDKLPSLTVNQTDNGRPVAEYTDPIYEYSSRKSLGMIVFYAQSSHLGQWEIKISGKDGQWEPLFVMKAFKTIRYDIRMVPGKKLCTMLNMTNINNFILLSATDQIRFRVNSSWSWWNKLDAMKYTLLIYSAWDMSDSVIPSNWPCIPHPSVASDIFLFSLEYKDCSGRRIINQPLLVDSCGVCGGDGTSCRLCGDRGKDCSPCGLDVAGNSVQPDCAGSCEQSNVLVTVGKRRVCVRKEEVNTLCDGSKNSSAVINRCGHCVGGHTTRSMTYGLDMCGVCGGRNECIGCDGAPFSGFTLDECGQCLTQSDDKRNYCSYFSFNNNNRQYFLAEGKVNSFCYEFYTRHNLENEIVSKCNVRNEVNNSAENTYFFESQPKKAVPVDSSNKNSLKKFQACFSLPREMYFWPSSNATIECHVLNYSSTSEEILSVERSLKFIQLDFRKNYVAKITPTTVYNNKSIELTADVKNTSSTNFKCIYTSRSSSSFMSSENAELTGISSVRCYLPQIPLCQEYSLLLVDESWTEDDVSSLTIVSDKWQSEAQTFLVIASAPEVFEAVVSNDLQEIQIQFTVNVFISNNCSVLFTSQSLKKLGFKDFSCWHSSNVLFLYLQSTVRLSLNMTLEFASYNGIRTFCPPNHVGDEAEGMIHVKLPQTKVKPRFFLYGPQQVCTGVVQLQISQIIGGGPFGLMYSWSVTSQPAVNLSGLHDLLYNKTKSVEIPLEMLQPDVRYNISVFGENVLGALSDTYSHTVVRKDSQQLVVLIVGLMEIDPGQENIYVAEVDECFEHVFPLSFYWSVNSSDFLLSDKNSPVLKIPKHFMKRNRFYEITVTVVDERNQVLMSKASKTIRTKEVPLVASMGMKLLILGYKQSFCLNGSYSYDPSKENTTMYYQWMCFLDNGLPCHITQDDGDMLRLEQVIGDAVRSPVLCIKGGLLLPQNYNITLLVKKDTRSASSSVVVKVIENVDVKAFTLLDTPHLNSPVNPERDLKVYYHAEDSYIVKQNCSKIIVGFDCIENVLSLCHSWNGQTKYFIIPTYKMSARKSYYMLFNSVDEKLSDSFPVLTFTTARAPIGGTFKVRPSIDSALIMDFTLDASEGWWTSINRYPLTYQFFYTTLKNVTSYAIELTNSIFTGIARNVILPCNTKDVIVKVCDAYSLCVNATQPVDARCIELGTTQGISSLEKLINSGNCLRVWSVVENLREVLIEQDSMQLLNTVIKRIKDCYVKTIEQYNDIFHDDSDEQNEEPEEQRQIMSVFQPDNFTDYMKIELLAFQDAVFQSFKILGSYQNVQLFPKILTVISPSTQCQTYSGSISNITISSREESSQATNTSLKNSSSSGFISNMSLFYGMAYAPGIPKGASSFANTPVSSTESSVLISNTSSFEIDASKVPSPNRPLPNMPVFYGMPYVPRMPADAPSSVNTRTSSTEKSVLMSSTPSFKTDAPKVPSPNRPLRNRLVFYGMPYVPRMPADVPSSVNTRTSSTEKSVLMSSTPSFKTDVSKVPSPNRPLPNRPLPNRPVFYGMPYVPRMPADVPSSVNTRTSSTEKSVLMSSTPSFKTDAPKVPSPNRPLRNRLVFYGMPYVPRMPADVPSSVNTRTSSTEKSVLMSSTPSFKTDVSKVPSPIRPVFYGMPYVPRMPADVPSSVNTRTSSTEKSVLMSSTSSFKTDASKVPSPNRPSPNRLVFYGMPYVTRMPADVSSSTITLTTSVQNRSFSYNTPRKRVVENNIPILNKIVPFLLHLPLQFLTHLSNTHSEFGTNSILSNYGYQESILSIKRTMEQTLTKLLLSNAFFDLMKSKSIKCVQHGNCETILEQLVSHKLFISPYSLPPISNRLIRFGDNQSHYKSDMMPSVLDDAKFKKSVSSETYENSAPVNGTLRRNISSSIHHVLRKRQTASGVLRRTDTFPDKLESVLTYFGNEDFVNPECVFRISEKKIRNLLEEMMYQLQWDLDEVDKKVKFDAVQVPHNKKDKSINITQNLRQPYQKTVYYSRDAGNYLVSATWITMLEEYKSRNQTLREVVEYEIRWDFDDSHDIMVAGLATGFQSHIVSRGSCQTLLQPDGLFYQLEPQNRVLYYKNYMTMKLISMFHGWSLYIAFKFSTKNSTCPDESICRTLCISVKYFSLEAATYVFPRSNSKLISEVISVMPSYSESGAMFWGEEFHITLFFPIHIYNDNAKCSRWNGKMWEDNSCKILEIRSDSFVCMTFSSGFYGIFTSQESNGSTEFTKVNNNTFALYNDTNPVAVQITLVNLREQWRKQQRFINHIQNQLALILGIQTTRIHNVRLVEDRMQIQFTILPTSSFFDLETSPVEAVRTLSNRINTETLNLTDIVGYKLLALPYSLVLIEPDDDYFNKDAESASESTTSFGKFETFIVLFCGVVGVVLALTGLIILNKRCLKSAKSVSVAPAIFPSSVNEERKY
ncbi:uncharacterized protein LOC143244700 [Tachypleus tridentatus]|uniref:uncharacterized protein LOC143244700 n=1 Tax=Tachypleus tridentatus TaxID=6853 RepID=UPI003FD116E8